MERTSRKGLGKTTNGSCHQRSLLKLGRMESKSVASRSTCIESEFLKNFPNLDSLVVFDPFKFPHFLSDSKSSLGTRPIRLGSATARQSNTQGQSGSSSSSRIFKRNDAAKRKNKKFPFIISINLARDRAIKYLEKENIESRN
jgi:hypothetical protein